MGEHEFVTFGIEAEGRWMKPSSSSVRVPVRHRSFGQFNAFLDVVALEAVRSFFALAASVNTDGGTTKGDFAQTSISRKDRPQRCPGRI